MQSVEWKAELRDPSLVRAVLRRAGAVHADTLDQRDTYFRVADGMLKKRESPGEPTEFIHYRRAYYLRPKISRFTVYSEEQAAERFGTLPMPVWLVVEKKREVWLDGGARIHLDAVQHLGDFIEIELLVSRKQTLRACHDHTARLRRLLGPLVGEPIAVGYAQLMALELETHDDAA